MPRQENHQRNADLAKIHLAVKDLGLDDDTYRAVLWEVCKAKSAKDLDINGRVKLLEHFKALGWKPKSKGLKKGNPQLQKIQALWLELHRFGQVRNPSIKALTAFCKRVTGVDRLEWLDGGAANKVIEALKDWEKRSVDGKA